MSTDDQKPCRLSEDLSFRESSSMRYAVIAAEHADTFQSRKN